MEGAIRGLAWLALCGVGAPAAHAEDAWKPTDGWFTLHHDVMRSGRTQYSPGAPFRYVWHREYWGEIIAPEAEPIVAEGLVYFGTFKGIIHALDAGSGRERWRADLSSPIHHSPAYAGGRLVAATMSPLGQVVAFRASSGRELWRFTPHRPGGFAASPAIYRGTVFIGDRAGDFYAIDAATGRRRWTAHLGGPILQSAAIRDGRVAIAAEDLVPRLLSAATGREIWHGPQMDGATVRGYYPVFWRDRVIWRTDTDAIGVYQNDIEAATEDGRLYRATREKYGWSPQAEAIIRTFPGRYTDAKYRQEQRYVEAAMAAGRHPRSFYAFSVTGGAETVIPAVGYHASENGYSVPASPPIGPDGSLYAFSKSVYSEWTYPIREFDAVSVLDYTTGLPHLIRGIDRSAGSFPVTCDESNNLVVAGDLLFDTHDHVLAYMDLHTRKVYNAYSSHAPELWGGVFKAYAPDNPPAENPGAWHLRDVLDSLHLTVQWNGPAQGSVAIYRDRVWWITGSMVVCLKGTSEPRRSNRRASAGPLQRSNVRPMPVQGQLPRCEALAPGPAPARKVPLTPGPSPARGEGSPKPKTRGEIPLPRPLAFPYDSSRTYRYLDQSMHGATPGRARVTAQVAALRRKLASAVDEILDGPWQPLYSDYSAVQAGGVGPAEWCFNRPGDYLLSLARAAPYISAVRKARARRFMRALIRACPPTRQVYLASEPGKPRCIRRTPAPASPPPDAPEAQRLLFEEAYAVWAYADAFDAWDEVRPLFADLRRLRADLLRRDDFAPAYRAGDAGPLTTADARNAAYRFRVYQSLLAGYHDDYGYKGAREARQRMRPGRPVFFYVKMLSALIGYYRLARRLGQPDDARWARRTFDAVAALTLGQRSAPFLWSDPALCPEVGRLIRDAAGSWLDALARMPPVGSLPATDWDGRIVPGRRDNFVIDPYTWFHAWGGHGEGVRPSTVLGAFLASAYLLSASPDRIAQTIDVPWCKADLYYTMKLAAAIQCAGPGPFPSRSRAVVTPGPRLIPVRRHRRTLGRRPPSRGLQSHGDSRCRLKGDDLHGALVKVIFKNDLPRRDGAYSLDYRRSRGHCAGLTRGAEKRATEPRSPGSGRGSHPARWVRRSGGRHRSGPPGDPAGDHAAGRGRAAGP